MKGGAEILALGQDGAPAQPGLKALEAQFLEQAPVIIDREAPLGVVIGQEVRGGTAPSAAQLPVRPRYGRAHMLLRKFRRGSALEGVISRISAFTTFSTTNGSLSTLLCRSFSDVLWATIPPPRLG